MPRRGKGEGSVFYHEARQRWVAQATYWQDGQRKRLWKTARTRAEAVQILRQALAQLDRGVPPPPERETVARFLERWLEDVVRPTVRPKTYASYRQLVRLYLLPGLGSLRLAQLTPADVQRFLNAQLARGLAPRTVAYLHAILRRALGQAEKWGLVARNVARLVTPPHVQRTEVQPLTVAQVRRLLATAQDDRLAALYILAVSLGLRQGELLGLRWQDVDLERGTLSVQYQLQRVDGRLQLIAPKTARSRRTLELPAPVVAALRAHQRRQHAERLAAGPAWQESGLVFTSAHGTPLDPRNVVRHFHGLLAQAGLPPKRFHDLRHTAASLLLAEGVDIRVVQQILGHSQIALTANLYAHVMPVLLKDAARKMEATLWG